MAEGPNVTYANVTPVLSPFRQFPVRMTCPQCHSEIVTKVEPEATKKTHILALVLCLLGLCCCAPVVYLVDECKAKKHTCPKCQSFLGMYDKILGTF